MDVFILATGARCVEKKLRGREELAAKTRGIPVARISLPREFLVEGIARASSGSDALPAGIKALADNVHSEA